MSHNPESKEVESEASNEPGESAYDTGNPTQEESSVTEANESDVKTTELNQSKNDSQETNEKKSSSAESNEDSKDSIHSSQEQAETVTLAEKDTKGKNRTNSSTNDLDKSASDTGTHQQEENNTTEVNHTGVKTEELSQTKINTKETNQQKAGSEISTQQERDSNQKQVEIVKFSESNTEDKKERNRLEPSPSRNEPDAVKQTVIWKVRGILRLNTKYLTQVRGLANILHIILSLTNIIILAQECQLRPFPDSPSEGFYCESPKTFLFIVACCSFFTAVIYLFSCAISETTDVLLFQSSFEIHYLSLYFILYLTAGISLVVSINVRSSETEMYTNNDSSPYAAATVGLINSVAYGLSALWFYLSRCK